MDSNDNLYIIPSDFFNEEGLKERLEIEFKIFRIKIKEQSREIVKTELNVFSTACNELIKDDEILLFFHLSFIKILHVYALKYKSKETIKNIISLFEKPSLKEKLFSKFPYDSKFVYARTWLYYCIERLNLAVICMI